MATTGEIASWVIKSNANGYNRTADVLPIINDVHKILYKNERSQVYITNPTTGRLPVLPTQENVYNYNAPEVASLNANEPTQIAWRVAGVYLRKPLNNDYDNNFDEYYHTEHPPINTCEYQEWGGNYYYKYQFVRTFDETIDVPARICFTRQPGDTTSRFYLLMYRKPREITSDRIQLQIPDSEGFHRRHFFPAVSKYIEAMNHGNFEETNAYIDEVVVPVVRKIMNSGAQGKRNRTQARYY